MDIYQQFLDVTTQEAARVAGESQVEELTHFVEDNGYRARVYIAICGKPVHAGEMKRLSSGDPSCQACRNLLAAFDAEGAPF